MNKSYKPEIGTAWLVLSHGSFLAAGIACSALGVSLLAIYTDKKLRSTTKPLAIGWVVGGIFMYIWTIYAIASTWKASKKMDSKSLIFNDFGFVFLTALTLYLLASTTWSLVVLSVD